MFSCLALGKPFSVRVVTNTNDTAWIALMTAKSGTWTIVWGLEEGYTTGGKLVWHGAIVDKSFGSPDIQGLVEGEIIIAPSGIPVATAGTAAS